MVYRAFFTANPCGLSATEKHQTSIATTMSEQGHRGDQVKDAFSRALFHVFLWLGARFFGACQIYSQSGYIKAVHFGVNEWHLSESVKQLAREDEVPKE